MKNTTAKLGILLLLTAALAGCSTKSSVSNGVTSPSGGSSGVLAQQASVSATLSTAPDLIEDGIAESADQMTLDSSIGGGLPGPGRIRPAGFWRRIDHVERSFEFAFADTDTTGQPTTAVVTIHKKLTGTFNLLASTPPPVDTGLVVLGGRMPPPPPDTSLHIVHKPLEDHWVRRLLLKRVSRQEVERHGDQVTSGDHRDDGPRWRIAATSGVKVTSNPNATQIESVRIQTAGRDTTITDPLGMVRLRRFCRFTSGDSVRVTVTTNHSDDIVVLNYRGVHRRFVNNGDNTYSATFRSAWFMGVNHLGVNALSHGTLFDDAAAYDSDAWILPYVVAPTMLADYRP